MKRLWGICLVLSAIIFVFAWYRKEGPSTIPHDGIESWATRHFPNHRVGPYNCIQYAPRCIECNVTITGSGTKRIKHIGCKYAKDGLFVCHENIGCD